MPTAQTLLRLGLVAWALCNSSPALALQRVSAPSSQDSSQAASETHDQEQAASGQEDGHEQDTPLLRIVPDEIELSELFDLFSKFWRVGIDYRPGQIQGKLSIRGGPGITEAELWATANRALAEKGMACIQIPGEGTLSVVKLEDAVGLARVEYGDPALARAGFIKALRELRGPEPSRMADTLKKVMGKNGSFIELLPGSPHIMLAGLKPQVMEALDLLDAIDLPGSETRVEEFPVENLSPIALAALLEQLAQQRKAIDGEGLRGKAIAQPGRKSLLVIAPWEEIKTWRDLIERFDVRESTLVRDYVPRRFGLHETAGLLQEIVGVEPGEGWRVVVDELTGTLIVSGTASQHGAVEDLLDRLEGTETGPRKTLRSFPVRNRDVEELLSMLEGLLEAGVVDAGVLEEPSPEVPEAQGPTARLVPRGPTRTVKAMGSGSERGITLSADVGTNRILAYGDVYLLGQVEKLLATLDVQHPQVLVETLVVSLTESQMRDIGVELRDVGAWSGASLEMASLFGLGAPEIGASGIAPPGGSGFTGVILNPGDFSGLVRAIEAVNEGRTLTIPKVLVSNHETASLDSVLQTPFLSTSSNNTASTTALGGTQDAGTSISVQPHIMDGDKLRISYSVSISTFVGDSVDPALPPPRQENRLVSVVTIPDGFTAVIGGLEMETESEAVSRLPLLGDLPIIGALFRSTSTSKTRSRFFVFLRCSVLRSQSFEDLRYLSARDMLQAGIDDPMPKLRPRVIR